MLSSKHKLMSADSARFIDVKPALFSEIAQVICSAEVLPEKELHECWQTALRVHAMFPEHIYIADLAAGHGLLAWILVLMGREANTSLRREAVAIDVSKPKSAEVISSAFTRKWPQLRNMVRYVEASIDSVVASQPSSTLFVSIHACGSLSDRCLLTAVRSGVSLAFMPCCHSLQRQSPFLQVMADQVGLSMKSLEANPASIDKFRIQALQNLGYEVQKDPIAADITQFNQLILAIAPAITKPVGSLNWPGSVPTIKSRGEVLAHELIDKLDVCEREAVVNASNRPSRESIQYFDLSFLLRSPHECDQILRNTEVFLAKGIHGSSVRIIDNFIRPLTNESSVTVRIELNSSIHELSRPVAMDLRQKLMRYLSAMHQLKG